MPNPTPPPSPPAGFSPTKVAPTTNLYAGTIVPHKTNAPSTAIVARSAPQVMPSKGNQKEESGFLEDLLTWDERSTREIVWMTAREHTLLGCAVAFLFGDHRKLPTVAQAAQLFWGSLIAMLFLACVQLRYGWLGATWAGDPIDSLTAPVGTVMDRMPVLSTVGLAAAIVGYPGVLVCRWIFFAANRIHRYASPEEDEEEKEKDAKDPLKAEKAKQPMPKISKIAYGISWSVVCVICLALCVGAVSMAGTMDAGIVGVDVIVGWTLGVGVQWLLIEPALLGFLAAFTLFLKWCTTIDEEMLFGPKGEATNAVTPTVAKEEKSSALSTLVASKQVAKEI